MARQLFIGGTVPTKRARLNPNSVFGYGRLNTFVGLDYISTVREMNEMIRCPHAPRGKRSHVHTKRGLDQRNLCHKASDPRADRIYAHFERARVLSLQLDRDNPEGKGFQARMSAYEYYVGELIKDKADHMLNELDRRERARGVVRASITIRRLRSTP